MMDLEPSNWMKPHVTSWRAARHANVDHISMAGGGGGCGQPTRATVIDKAVLTPPGVGKRKKNCWENGRLLIKTLKLAGCVKGPRTARLWVYLVCDAPPVMHLLFYAPFYGVLIKE